MDLWIGNKKISFEEAVPEYVLLLCEIQYSISNLNELYNMYFIRERNFFDNNFLSLWLF